MSRYRNEYRIGAGGMGEVFRVSRILDDGTASPAACKVMRGQLARDARGVRLFCREAVLGLAVGNDSQHVVSVYDFLARTAPDGEKTFYLIMELVEGVDLRDLVRVRERLSFNMMRCIARDVLSGLRYLHKRGVLHRDLSPSNVLLSTAGVAKVADFGVAKFVTPDRLQSESIQGKPAYLAPEMGAGCVVDGRADLFAFAATMYHLLSGAAPLGSSMAEMLARRADWRIDALPGHVPQDLRDVVTGLLVRDPDERVAQTAGEALAMLAEPAERETVADALGAIVDELYERQRERWQRHQAARAMLAEEAEYIDAAPVLDGFADTLRSGDEASSADEEQHETEITDGSGWPRMPPEVADQAAEAEAANGNGQTINWPRAALASVIAAAAVLALAIIGGVRFGGDQPAPIGWQLVQPRTFAEDATREHAEAAQEQERDPAALTSTAQPKPVTPPSTSAPIGRPPQPAPRPARPTNRAPRRIQTMRAPPATSAQPTHSQPYRGKGSTWSDDWVYLR